MKRISGGATFFISYFILQTSNFGRFGMECGVDGACQWRGGLNIVLGLVVAGFAAVGAVVLAVFGEPDAVIRMAKSAVLLALATIFRLAANTTSKDLPRHGPVLLSARGGG